jgi:hypothetical protein
MAKKAGKGKKAAVRKPAPKKQVRSRKVAAPKPAAPVQAAAPQEAVKAPPEYPWNVLVVKGAEKVPVTVTDEAHYKRLCAEFGAIHIEVQS